MGQEIIVNALPLLTSLLLTFTPATQSAVFTPLQPLTIMKEPARQERTIVWKVKEKETLTSIATAYYGDKKYWTLLWADNQWIENPHLVQKDWKLTLRHLPVSDKELALVVTPTPRYTPTPLLQPTALPTEGSINNPAPTQVPVMDSSQFASTYKPSNFDQVYQEAGTKYGVPWEVLYGLHLTETGLRDGAISSGYGTGAQGPMQFMPGTWRAYGVDGNGDGVADINSAVDAIHGAANYLATHGGWETGLRYYGGNTSGVLAAARSRGFSQ